MSSDSVAAEPKISRRKSLAASATTTDVLPSLGDAITAIFLLRDYEKFGFTERVCYHFDLTEALATTEKEEQDDVGAGRGMAATVSKTQDSESSRSSMISETCGVASLLECAPVTPWHRLSKRQKRALKHELRSFNTRATQQVQNRRQQDEAASITYTSYQPKRLPLRLNPSTRMFFAYEVTRIAFCVDASPSMTSTFGINGSGVSASSSAGPCCCPLDRLPEMARTFFSSLVEPVSAPSLSGAGIWKPLLAVTVIAVFPLGQKAETSLLVRDYRVDSVAAAHVLADQIEQWIYQDVEVGISERLIRRHPVSTWSMPLYSSSLQDIIEAGDYALSVLSSDARPLIVVATDGRSVSADGIVDVFLDFDRVDIPVIILDTSMPETHASEGEVTSTVASKLELNFLTYDPGGPSAFPLHLSDDTESLYEVCRATGGCFLDYQMLQEHSKRIAGQQLSTEAPAAYHYSYKRRFVKMNGLQWLTLFSLSPLSPRVHASSDKMAPPNYIQKRLKMGIVDAPVGNVGDPLNFSRHENFALPATDLRRAGMTEIATVPTLSNKKSNGTRSRTPFATYFVSPVRIKALLVMRIKEGFRTRQYGKSTQDADKVFIQFVLPLEMGTILHYELSYTALSSKNHMIGSAHIKIELSGEPTFVQNVKNDFLEQGSENRPFTMAQKVSSRLCQVMRGIRKEDILQSYLSPPSKWSDQFSSQDSPMTRRLCSMTKGQRRRHFRSDEFDVICTGQMPYLQDHDFLSEFVSEDTGVMELKDLLKEWSTQILDKENTRYVKATSTMDGNTLYCLMDLCQSSLAPRLFTISLEFYGGTDVRDRLRLLEDLKGEIQGLKQVEVLGKQMLPFLVGTSGLTGKKRNVDFQFHHAQWDLIKDPELLPLVMKRRIEIGRFRLMQSNDNTAIFAKVEPETVHDVPGDLMQYQIAILDDKVVVDLHMESECGLFFPFGFSGEEAKRFNNMVQSLRRRDQECGRALRSRTNLLRVLQDPPSTHKKESGTVSEDHQESVKRMLQYSSRVSKKLRYFNRSASGANDVLSRITVSLLLSKSFGVKAAKLSIEQDEPVKGEDPGLWFVIQFDRDTMSIVHLSVVDQLDTAGNTESQTYRNLTFFTSGISDLYTKRDDSNDDDSVDTHISEYLCVTEFAEHFEVAEKHNFATAAYLALRKELGRIDHFGREDFDMIVASLEFFEVAAVLVAGQGSNKKQSKLLRLIQTILSPVPGDDTILFYSGGQIKDDESFDISDDEMDSLDASADTAELTDLTERGESEALQDLTLRPSAEDDESPEIEFEASSKSTADPIFVRFKLDGETVPFKMLGEIDKSSNLTAEVSALKKDDKRNTSRKNHQISLPRSHQLVAGELNVLLKWYVAEQTVERLRSQGSSISDDDLKIVKKCMKRIRDVYTFSIEIFFYVSRSDMMVPASAPAGGESEVSEGFLLLDNQLRKSTQFKFNPVPSGGFFVSNASDNSSLAFWCFVYVQPIEGLVTSQIYHPDGEGVAMKVMAEIHESIRSCLRRVNQLLMLKSLHRNRTASNFLIPRASGNEDAGIVTQNLPDEFPPGFFACPVVFGTIFDLFHRCATNPGQVARNLEATVLHSFAVSNRSGVFVYKDEDGAIFYMKLHPRGSGLDGDGQVELLVHGIDVPGPSVTEQLKQILQRRILLIAVDMLSAVLTKNPHFRVSGADLDFLRSFDGQWSNFTDSARQESNEILFEFPDVVYDPVMVLLMFRQNLCGSTFFHRLNDIGYEKLSPSITERESSEQHGSTLSWNEHDFTLYYNNAPSKLDHSFQGISTLTERGAELSRQVGTGIAMLEMMLVRSDGLPVDEVLFAKPGESIESSIGNDTDKLRFHRIQTLSSGSDRVCVRVRITDTALSREHLYEWIELTLNQALTAWIIERGIEVSMATDRDEILHHHTMIASNREEKMAKIDKICPGLASLTHLLESSHSLPHPAVAKIENNGVIRASSVSTKTLTLLEACVFGSIIKNRRADDSSLASMGDLRIIRISRYGTPQLVRLSWDPSKRKALVHITTKDGSERLTQDSPIDCPEYVCFYQLSSFGGKTSKIDENLQLYKEVMIHDGISDRSASIELLESIKSANPSPFMRSFSFIFSMKRNRRCLLTYNWHPNLVKSITSRMQELEQTYLEETGRSVHSLQFKSLQLLAPPTRVKALESEKQEKTKDPPKVQKASSGQPNKPLDQPLVPSRRIRRPVMIRRPKLVGKSVEGAAMHAVAASRKRASSNQFKNVATPVASRRTSSTAPARESSLTSSSSELSLKNLGRPPSSRRIKDREQADENLVRIKKDFSLMRRFKFWQLRRESTLQREAALLLSNAWWPKEAQESIPFSVAEFITAKIPFVWSSSCRLPPTPDDLGESFTLIFARWIALHVGSLRIVPITATAKPELRSSVFVASSVRNVRGRKCFTVIKISSERNAPAAKDGTIIRCQGWVVSLPRRSAKRQVRKRDSNVSTAYLLEKDATGMDVLAGEVRHSLFLESLLFDFSSSIIERAARKLDDRLSTKDLIPILRSLMTRYPLEQQKRMPRLNYRIFEAHVVLKSFMDPMISKYDSVALIHGLHVESSERDLIRCGAGLCFKKGLSIKGSHSLCFLTSDPVEATKMRLIILCRTQGRNLSDYIFRDGSNVATHIIDYIVYEAADMLYNELKSMSTKLHRDSLWASLSSPNSKDSKEIESLLQELLALCEVKPILESLGNNIREGGAEILSSLLGKQSGIDWATCCQAMEQDDAFSTCWTVISEEVDSHLVFAKSVNVLFTFKVDKNGLLQSANLVEKDDSNTAQHRQVAFQSFADFLLQFLWQGQ